MNDRIKIYGGVIVHGVVYEDDDIAKLVDIPFRHTDWDVAGDLDILDDGVNIVINGKIFDGPNFLPNALAYLCRITLE